MASLIRAVNKERFGLYPHAEIPASVIPVIEPAQSGLELPAITFNCASFPTSYGTEFTSTAILKWAGDTGVAWHYIDPGKPQQNG